MLYLLFGEDDFSLTEFLQGLLEELGPPEVQAPNVTRLSAQGLTSRQVLEVCSAVPFLAERRLVIVEGLWEALGSSSGRRPAARPGAQGWETLPELLEQLPETTTLVFRERALPEGNLLFQRVRPLLQVKGFPLLRGEALGVWVRQQVAQQGGAITPQAVRLLTDSVGPNLWTLKHEVEKLVLYASRGPIGQEEVQLLVAHTREASVFAAVDAILEGRGGVAFPAVSRLLQDGVPPSNILTLLARQLRLTLLAQDLLARGVPRQELGRRLGLPQEFALRRTLELGRRHPPDRLVAFFRRLLETDLAVKRGEVEEGLAVETLVAELASASTG